MMQKVLWYIQSDWLKILPILGLAFYMAFIPHLGYLYPIHIDEWVHISFANELMAKGGFNINEPFTGNPLQMENRLEFGFQLPLGIFQRITGISWISIFRFFPSLIFMVTIFFVYLFARREGYGWQAALLACLVPTTAGILGPAFLVPVAVGLLFLPLMLSLVFNYRRWWSYLLLFIFTSFLISMHGPSIVCIVIITLPYIFLNSRKEPKHSLKIAAALFLPFILVLPFAFEVVSSLFHSLITMQPPNTDVEIPNLLSKYGYLPVILAFVGVFGLSLRGGVKNMSLMFGLLFFSCMLVIFSIFGFGISSIYTRGLLFEMLLLSIIGGAGLREIGNIKLPKGVKNRFSFPLLTKYFSVGLSIVIICFTLATVIPMRQTEPYYYTIDKTDYDAFIWIRDNISKEYDRAILDPLKAAAFTAITGRHVYTRTQLSPTAAWTETQHFIRNGSVNTKLLKENGLSIVFTRLDTGQHNIDFRSDNPDLEEVAQNIYLLKDPKSR